ncbi:MAG: antitoxin Xre/MbcA/ParS toxin-binding domain-containing protein [Actinomycetota bacterium]
MTSAKAQVARAAKRAGRRAVRETALGYDAFGARERVARCVKVLGNKLVADALGVSPSQPSRWRSGKERVSAETLPLLIDLDYVVSRLSYLMHPKVIESWLYGNNPFVGGRPIDVLLLRGPMALKPALDAEEAGSYA